MTAIVHLVDDDASFLRALARLVRLSGFTVSTHSSADDFLATLLPSAAGCVVADLAMPGMDGMRLQTALREAASLLPVIFLTGHGTIPATVQAMRLGAEDFLTKQAPKQDLLAAITRALARNATAVAERERQRSLQDAFRTLTRREQEVMHLVVQGKLNKQISAELGIHERTVKLHRTNLTSKLQVRSVAELTRLAQQAGLLALR